MTDNNSPRLGRRAFIRQLTAGSLSLPFLINLLSDNLTAKEIDQKQPIIWLHGQSSSIQRAGIWSYPNFYDFIQKYFTVISVDDPEIASLAIRDSESGNPHLLILDGFFSASFDDLVNNLLKDLIVISRAVILLGNEAAYSHKKPQGFLDLEEDLLDLVETPYIKLPGNPVPIRHLVGLLNHMVMFDLPELDGHRRPLMFYSQTICERCQYRGDFEKGNFVRYFGQKEGCLYWLGCKGPITRNSCVTEKWMGTSEWCISAGSPCTGCSEPDFPDNNGLGLFGQISADKAPINSFFVRNASTIAQGAFAVTLSGVAAHAISRKTSPPLQDETFFNLEENGDE